MEENDLIDPDTLDWIMEIKSKSSALMQAVEELDDDVNNSCFDIGEVRLYFDTVEEKLLELKTLLHPDREPEDSEDEEA